MAGKIFVNYRRDDERAYAARIRDRLAVTFGRANVFMDVDNLQAGQRFDREVEKALTQCDVFLAVIGAKWLDLLHARLHKREQDYVRDEIAEALSRNILIIPILIDRTPLPKSDLLPQDIRDLVLHQKHEIAHERFGRDVEELVQAIKAGRKTVRPENRRAPGSLKRRMAWLVGVVLTMQLGWLAYFNGATLPAMPRFDAYKARQELRDPKRLEIPPLKGFSGPQEVIDARLQQAPLWRILKSEFPDWYTGRLKDAAGLAAQDKDDATISSQMAQTLVALRRQQVSNALSASAPRLKALAAAFYDNLEALRKHSDQACYEFIAQGELSPIVLSFLREVSPHTAGLQRQMVAVYEAIADGRKAPRVYPTPRKADYDTLAGELTKLGWSQSDMALFSDEQALARAQPQKVCQLVHDWFQAQLGLKDADMQLRMLVDSLKPVVAG